MKDMKNTRLDKLDLSNFAAEKPENGEVAGCSENDLFVLVPIDEKESEHLTSEPYSYWRSVFRSFVRKPSAIVAIISLVLLFIGIVIIPTLTPAGFLEYNLDTRDLLPSWEHLWGTDPVGRDLFFMTWTAAGKSLRLALVSASIILFVGTIMGLIWGFFRHLDPIFIELNNLIMNIPSLLIYMLLAYVFTQAFPTWPVEIRLIISLTLTSWLGLARFVRNQVLIINNREYNIASKTLGTPPHRIMMRNLLPYILSVVITDASLIIPGLISSEVSMSYFGVGLPSSSISIGALLELGRTRFELYPFQLLAPAGLLAFIIFTFFLLGLALTDALDPKKHR